MPAPSPIPVAIGGDIIIDGIVDCLPQGQPERAEHSTHQPAVSVLILAKDEAGSLADVITATKAQLELLKLDYEVVVIDGHSVDRTAQIARELGAKVFEQTTPGYAAAFREGLEKATGRWIIALDADCSHPPDLIPQLVSKADTHRIVVGSRWMSGGSFAGAFGRGILSRILSQVFRRILSLPVQDVSSGYRLYHREILRPAEYTANDFSILQEVLIRALSAGHAVGEVPLKYAERTAGKSHVALASFAVSYVKTLARMWLLRNGAECSDYDARAYDSWNLLQRFWQRQRFKKVMRLLGEYRTSGAVIDIGCGSSRITQTLSHCLAFDHSLPKLRALAATNKHRVRGSALALPFADATFDCVIHSQLLQFLPDDGKVFTELRRVLKPGGALVIGTVDFGRPWWPMIRRAYRLLMPYAYVAQTLTRYSEASLTKCLNDNGFAVDKVCSILKGEIILRATRQT